jgi:hypothetical protein
MVGFMVMLALTASAATEEFQFDQMSFLARAGKPFGSGASHDQLVRLLRVIDGEPQTCNSAQRMAEDVGILDSDRESAPTDRRAPQQ